MDSFIAWRLKATKYTLQFLRPFISPWAWEAGFQIHKSIICLDKGGRLNLDMSHNKNRSYTCTLVIDVEAPSKKRAAEQLLQEIEEGWILPEDISVS